MNKVVDFLEKRVEWIALALGVLFAGYMAYSYLLLPKVVVTGVAPDPMPPGEVDRFILEHNAADLELRMARGSTAANDTVKPPSFVESFLASMSYANDPAKPLQYANVYLPHTDMISGDQIKGGELVAPANVPAKQNPAAPVASLGQPPAPAIEKITSGLTNVLPQPAAGGGMMNPAMLPVGVQGVDKSWAAVLFHIDTAGLQSTFDTMKVPAAQASTTLLHVVVERQEMEPSGKWGAATVVPPLSITTMQPYPADNADPTDKAVYIQWATQHVVDILRPTFYQTIQGDKWGFAEQKPTVAAQQTFDPSQFAGPNITRDQLMALTPLQRQLVQKYKDTQARQNRGAGRQPAGTPRPPRGGIPPEDAIAPQAFDPDRVSFQVAGYDPRLDLPEPNMVGPNGMPMFPEQLPTENPADMIEAGVGTAPGVTAPVPPGQFMPSQWITQNPQTPNIIGWFTDETVIPGRTYRYRVSYTTKNPVFFMQQLVKDPKLADVFALKSPPSEWSSSVEIASTINFWVVNQRNNAGTVSVQVFRWIAGQPKTKTYEVAPGDKIGGQAGDVDFNTGWTMIDLRTDLRGNDPYVLLLDPEGRIHRRDVRSDASDPRFQKLRETATTVAVRLP
jgi:hypothetical protein